MMYLSIASMPWHDKTMSFKNVQGSRSSFGYHVTHPMASRSACMHNVYMSSKPDLKTLFAILWILLCLLHTVYASQESSKFKLRSSTLSCVSDCLPENNVHTGIF